MNCTLTLVFPRDGSLAHRERIEHLERECTPLIRALPGIERFTTAVPLDPGRIGGPLDSEGPRYDGMARLQFESPGALRAAFDTVEGRRVVEEAETVVSFDECVTVAVAGETLQFRAIPADL